MKRLALVLLASAVPGLCLPRSSPAQWEHAGGPGGCNITALVVSGTILFAGTSNGVFSSTNNGASWRAVSSGLPKSMDVRYIEVSGKNLFAVSQFGTAFLSTNNGASWGRVPTNGPVGCLVFSGTILFAGRDFGGVFGVYRSTDNGTSWTAVNKGLPEQPAVSWLTVLGTNIFAGLRDVTGRGAEGLFVSGDNGESWKAVKGGLPERPGIIRPVVSGSNLFAVTASNGIYLSTNNGASWTAVDFGATGVREFNFLAASGINLYAANCFRGLFLSTNNGKNWEAIDSGLPRIQINGLAVIGPDIFVATQGLGVFRSSDNGHSWKAVNSGLPDETEVISLAAMGAHVFADVDCHVSPPGEVIFRSADNGESWTAVSPGLPSEFAPVNCLAVMGANLFAGSYKSVFRSSDKGTGWTKLNSGLPEYADFIFLAASGTNLFTGTDEGIYLSTDNGARWTAVGSGWPERPEAEIVCFAANGPNLYAGIHRPWISGVEDMRVKTFQQDTGLGVFLSTDNGAAWKAFNSGLPKNPYVTCLATSGSDLFAGLLRPAAHSGKFEVRHAVGLGVFRSAGGNETWTAANSGLPANTIINCLIVYGPNVLAGTAGRGVFVTRDSGKRWTALNSGMPPNADVRCIAVSGEVLYAGTSDHGIWRLPLSALEK